MLHGRPILSITRMITGWIGLESVLLPILITHQNSIWFWLLSRNFLLCFISFHSCITINQMKHQFSSQWSSVADIFLIRIIEWWDTVKDVMQTKNFKGVTSRTFDEIFISVTEFCLHNEWHKFTLQECPSVEWLQSWEIVCDVFYTKVSRCDLTLIWLLILPSSCYTFPCILLGRIWYYIKITASNW